jgi:hypothetical protein
VQSDKLQSIFRILAVVGALLSLTGMVSFMLHANAQISFWILFIALIDLITAMAGLIWLNFTRK